MIMDEKPEQPRFKYGDLIVEDLGFRSWGIILSSGKVSYDVVWQGGSTSRYRYDVHRQVRLATPKDLEGMNILIEHLQKEVADARAERREGKRIKRGAVSPRRS